MPIAVGETFHRFEILSLIGRGGMGEVYLALDTHLRRKVALKVLRPDRDNADAVARLFREARAAAGLTHPNTIGIHDIGESEGTVYIVMELVTGAPLLEYIGDERVSPARKLGWLVQVARALSAAHKAGVIHRDVKPSNVMVTDEDVVKVLDFGLAKPLAPASFRTQQGQVLGTPRYMSPEQLAGSDIDARSDQYSFGLVAYELLCGKHPGGVLAGPDVPRPLDDVSREITPAVAAVIGRTLSTGSRDRFESMDEVASALDDAIAGRPVRGLAAISMAADTLRAAGPVESMAASTETSPRMLAAEEVPAAGERPVGKTARLEISPLAASVGAKPALERTLLSLDASLDAKPAPVVIPPEPSPPPPPAPPPPASVPPSAPETTRRLRTSSLAVLCVAIVVLGACTFTGAYFGARALTPRQAALPTSALPATASLLPPALSASTTPAVLTLDPTPPPSPPPPPIEPVPTGQTRPRPPRPTATPRPPTTAPPTATPTVPPPRPPATHGTSEDR